MLLHQDLAEDDVQLSGPAPPPDNGTGSDFSELDSYQTSRRHSPPAEIELDPPPDHPPDDSYELEMELINDNSMNVSPSCSLSRTQAG